MQAINPPRPTHADMVLVQSQGRDTPSVQEDLAKARLLRQRPFVQNVWQPWA